MFDSLNEPVNSVMHALEYRYKVLDFLPSDMGTQFVFWNVVALVYWSGIGLFFAGVVCVIRILALRLQTQRGGP